MDTWSEKLGWLGDHCIQWVSRPGFLLGTCLLAVLVGGAFILLRYTKLGQARLIWKCAVLSLLAHILLAVYTYGTYYVLAGPPLTPRQGLTVHLIDPIDSRDSLPEESAPLQSWDEFANEQVMPEVEPLLPPLSEPELEIERVFAESQNAIPQTDSPEVPKLLDAPPTQLTPMPPTQGLAAISAESSTPLEPQTISEQRPPEVSSHAPPVETEVHSEPADSALTDESPGVLERELPLPNQESFGPVPLDASQTPIPVPAIAESMQPVVGSSPPAHLAGFQRSPVSDVKEPATATPMPDLFSQRSPDQREQVLAARGGNANTELAVKNALHWLASQQSRDGRWDPRISGAGVENRELGQERRGAGSHADNGITALALLTFLAGGHTHQQGDYQDTVRRALEFLLQTQSQDGFLGGQSLNFERTYCHHMALLALSEAFAMTRDNRLRAAVQAGVQYSVRSQNANDGGWRYQPGDAGDMSQFGWVVLALHSAQASGIEIPPSTISGMQRFLHASTQGVHQGIGLYRPREKPSPTMTAEALVCRIMLHPQVSNLTIEEASTYLRQNLPAESQINYYYWYYGTLCMYQVGGEEWDRWNQTIQPVLLARQISSGQDAGSWPVEGMWSGYGGKVFTTALATLCLEVYYRYLPITDTRKGVRNHFSPADPSPNGF